MAEKWGREFIARMLESDSEVASHGYVHDMHKRYGGDLVYAGHYGPKQNREQVEDGVALLNRVLQTLGSAGSFAWGGAASTLFWVDPAEELIVIFLTQLMPSRTFDFRGQLQSLIYPALVD